MGDFLFARPSFLEGVSRIVDFGNTLNEYNCSPSINEADEKALYNDVKVVAEDIKKGIETYDKKIDE